MIHLSGGSQPGAVRFLSGPHVSLGEGDSTQSWVTITRTGTFTDPRYGRFDITREMLLAMVTNFDANTYGQDIVIDLNHDISGGAAAEIKALRVNGNRLRALVEWTPQGVEAVKHKRMKYLSAEFHPNYKDNEAGKEHGPTLLGAALTVRPVIKRLDPVELSEPGIDSPILLHPDLIKSLSQEAYKAMNKYLKALKEALAGLTLPKSTIQKLCEAYTTALGNSTDDEHAKALAVSFEETGKQLAEAMQANPAASIQLSVPGAGLDAAAVEKMLADRDAAAEKQRLQLAETRAAKAKLFSDTVNAADGLDDEAKKALCEEHADLIGENLTDDQVKKFAAHAIAHANDAAVSRQLGAMGYQVDGSPRARQGDDNSVKALQEQIDTFTGMKCEVVNPFVQKVLSEFDRTHTMELAEERKLLAGGATGISDTSLPAGFQRTVIRQALQDLNILNLVSTMTDFGASSTVNIPYETRDTSAVLNDGIVYEGQGIHGASVSQAMDIAYVNAMKLALEVSNEVAYFSRNNRNINWDAYARNVQSNSRVIRELICRRVANEMQRSADAYGAVSRASDTLTAQVDGSTSVFKTTYFPVVRPKQIYDIKGTAIGSASNPITVTLGGSLISAYDGTGTQSADTYYRVTSFNLGYIQTVDAAGTPVTPANGTALVVDYDEATNVAKFDLDNGTTSIEDHLNGLLRQIGARKAVLTTDRFVSPDIMFMLMSHSMNDTVTNARAFVESQARQGTMLGGKGDLSIIKGVEAFGTNAPGIDLGDERIVLGEAGVTAYNVIKPFATSNPFEAVDTNGKPTGMKVAYGEEYNAIHTPAPLRQRLTSVLGFSGSGR